MTESPRPSRHLSVVRPEPSSAAADGVRSAPQASPVPVPAERVLALTPAVQIPAVETFAAGMRYGNRWVLRDCTLRIPRGSVVAVVGRNGAGKTTLLQMLVGLSKPSAGAVRVDGQASWPGTAGLRSQIGFVAQDKPLYRGLRVADMLRMGARLNPCWDRRFAIDRLADRGVPLNVKVGKLSGGQRTQVALVMALAKRPNLLVLDEPLADLDPLARREVLGALMADLAERHVTVVLSSHVLADLARVCDWLVLIDEAQVKLCDPIEALLAGHRQVVGPAALADRVRQRNEVVAATFTDRQAVLLVRGDTRDLVADGRWEVRIPTLEELVFAHLSSTAPAGR